MTSEHIFTTKADVYARSRPSYAPEAIERVFSLIAPDGIMAADIGSGTGIFSREFLLRGYQVYCVEPNDAMRMRAEKALCSYKNFHSVAAPAENTTLPPQSISLLTAASAFHWFDVPAFYQECKRILTPDGIVCIIANARTYDDFTQRQHMLCQRYCHSYTSLTHGAEKVVQKADAFFHGAFQTERFNFPLHYTKSSFISRSLSSSYAPDKNTPEYTAYVHALQTLLDETFDHDPISIANETLLLWGKLH